MNRAEWQKFHGFDDEDMERIHQAIVIFSGIITSTNGDMYGHRKINCGIAKKRISAPMA